MTRLWPLVCLMLAAPGIAHALSCMAPNPAHEINWMLEKGRKVALITGRLTPVSEVPDLTPEGPPVLANYRLDGSRITEGNVVPVTGVEVLLTGVCAGPWCASLPRTTDPQLFVLEGEDETLTATIGPCQGTLHRPPDPDQVEALQRCLKGGGCSDNDVMLLEPRWD